MTLAEKILSLRTEKGMSQDGLAERLGVSRQSVSKWETGQSTPDLDKIIRLASLFGVSVDELVRDGEAPWPPEPPRPQVVFVEWKGELSPIQKLGVIIEASGAALAIIGIMGAPLLIWAAVVLVILGLPLLLSQKHPWLIMGWMAVGLSLLVFNPYTSITPWGLMEGIWLMYISMTHHTVTAARLFGFGIAVARGVVTLILAFFTGRLFLRAWREAKGEEQSRALFCRRVRIGCVIAGFVLMGLLVPPFGLGALIMLIILIPVLFLVK